MWIPRANMPMAKKNEAVLPLLHEIRFQQRCAVRISHNGFFGFKIFSAGQGRAFDRRQLSGSFASMDRQYPRHVHVQYSVWFCNSIQ